jgi:hypothetical protein
VKKFIVGGALILVLAAAAPAQATHGQYLGNGEACREAGAIIHSKWRVVPGSSRGNCYVARRSADKVKVWITYRARGAGWWTTAIGMHETSVDYRYRILYDRRADGAAG